jgi:hypothetical protein
MPTTKEQREGHALCGAKKKNGETCRLYAGQGTNHLGIGQCKYHLGNTQNQIKHAAKIVAGRRAKYLEAQKLEEFGQVIHVDPLDALLWTIHLSAGHIFWLQADLAALPDEDKLKSFEGQVLMRLWNEERERLARTAKLALDAGVAERQVAMAERFGEQLARLIGGILGDPELALNKRQVAASRDVVQRHLVALDAPKDA